MCFPLRGHTEHQCRGCGSHAEPATRIRRHADRNADGEQPVVLHALGWSVQSIGEKRFESMPQVALDTLEQSKRKALRPRKDSLLCGGNVFPAGRFFERTGKVPGRDTGNGGVRRTYVLSDYKTRCPPNWTGICKACLLTSGCCFVALRGGSRRGRQSPKVHNENQAVFFCAHPPGHAITELDRHMKSLSVLFCGKIAMKWGAQNGQANAKSAKRNLWVIVWPPIWQYFECRSH